MRNKILLRLVLFAVVTAISLFSFAGCSLNSDDFSNGNADEMMVSFVDVGQGDCIFVELPNSETMLVDCGVYSQREKVEQFLKDNEVEKIDYLIATHPHADHMGAMSHIINSFEIGKFFMPDKEAGSDAFLNMLEALDENSVDSSFVKVGDVIFNQDGARCDVLSPVLDSYDEVNDYSVVLKLTYDDVSFLLTGDAEKHAENLIEGDLKAEVLKVGHHGSSTSTSEEFLDRVSPDYAVICCGKDNSYGHPHDEVIKSLEERNIEILRTDELGTITILCDGESVEIE